MRFNPLGALRAVRDDASSPKLTATDKLVLMMLILRADAEGSSWPSHARIAADAGLSRRAVQQSLARLSEAGAIEVRRRALDGSKEADTNVYRVKIGALVSSDAEDDAEDERESPAPRDEQAAATPARPSARGSRLPPDWQPSDGTLAWAKERGVDASAAVDEFRDYWLSVAGAKGRKADWDRTFINRLRQLIDSGRAAPLPPPEWQPPAVVGTPDGAARTRSIVENLATAKGVASLGKAANHG